MARIAELIHFLRNLGIDTGDVLVFEAPGEEMQCIEGSMESLALALQGLIEPSGTLVVPTCTPTEGYPKSTFDPLISPSEMGPFSEFFRKQSGVLRSHSPTHSIAARGSIARRLLAGHRSASGRPTPWGEGAFGNGSPWDMLYEHNAQWVLADGNWRDTPFIGYVQALYAERHSEITKQTPFPRFDAEALGQKLEQLGLLHQATWGSYQVVAFEMRAAVDAALKTLEDKPEQLGPDEAFRKWLATVDYVKRNGYLQAGTAKAVITPRIPCLRWEGKQLTGVYRDLYVRVVVLSHGTQRIALVLCDLLGISGELVSNIRQRVQESIGFPAEAIQIACTHSHSTPDTIGSGYEDPEYLRVLVKTIAKAICDAAANKQSARMGWGRVPIRGLASSRRIKMTDGTVFTTRYGVPSTWRVNPELIVSKGRIDPDLTVIRVESLNGEVLAAISNFGCHASVALMSPNISGDFPGEAMAALERALGEPAVVLCTNGAAGDVDPTLEMPFWGPREDAMARHLGRILAAQVLECLERVDVDDKSVIGASQELVDLNVRPDWIRLLEVEQERMSQEFAGDWSLSTVTARTLQEKVIHTEVQALRLNDLILVGFPGEVFVEIGLKLKAQTPNRALAVVELANDDVGYIATQEAFSEGGYEVGQHLWGRVPPEATEILIAAARRAINELAE